MIVCAKCGNANEARDEFCGSCGAFLEWHGERVAEVPPPVQEVAPPPPAEKPKLMERVKYAIDGQIPVQQPPVIQTNGMSGGPIGGPPPVLRETPAPIGPPPVGGFPPPPPPLNPDAGLPPRAPVFPPVTTAADTATQNPIGGARPTYTPPPPPPVHSPPLYNPPPAHIPPQHDPQPHNPPPYDPTLGGRPPGQEWEPPKANRPKATDLGQADLYCGACGTGNAAGKRFCRKCGTSLENARVVQRSWWQRTFGGATETERAQKGLAVGERPKNWKKLTVPEQEQAMNGGAGGSKKKWKFKMPKLPSRLPGGRALGVVLLILSAVGAGVPQARQAITGWVSGAYHSVSQVVRPNHIVVTPGSVTADTAVKDHAAAFLIDRNPETYWSELRQGSGGGSVVTIVMAEPTSLSKIGFDNGATAKEYAAEPRLKLVEVSYFDKENTRTHKETLKIDDTDKMQDFDLEGEDVSTVVIKVLDVYPGQKGRALSVREIVFWRLK
jgi:hypothetical protein